jgi:hypothetical protein
LQQVIKAFHNEDFVGAEKILRGIIDLGEFKKALNYYEQSIQLSPDFMQMYKGYQADLASEHLFL